MAEGPRAPAPNAFKDRLREFILREGEGSLSSNSSVTRAAKKLSDRSSTPVSPEDIRKWLKGTLPPTVRWPHLSRGLGEAPSFIATSLGAIPGDGDVAGQVLQLAKQHEDWLRLMKKLHTDSWEECRQATLKMLKAALDTSGWTLAVTSAIEGPAGYEFHVADRIDIAPVDDRSLDSGALQEVLKKVGGGHIRKRHRRLKTQWNNMRAADTTQIYSVSFTSPARPPMAMGHMYSVIRSPIQIVSVSLTTWPADIGSLLACALGHGFVSTRYLAQQHSTLQMEASSPSQSELSMRKAETYMRETFHEQFLQDPLPRYVWAHFPGPYSKRPYLRASDAGPSELISIVILLEDASRMKRYQDRKRDREQSIPQFDLTRELERSHQEEEKCHQRLLDEIEGQKENPNLIVVPVTQDVRRGSEFEREDAWTYTFVTAATLLDKLIERRIVPRGYVADVPQVSDFHKQWWSWAVAHGRASNW